MALPDRRVLPGFSLTLGYTVFYLSILVLLPIGACFVKASSLSFEEFWGAVWTERARAASADFGALAAAVNTLLGLCSPGCSSLSFPGKVVDSLVDLPLAFRPGRGLVYGSLY
jgi:sulfate transport system permease protein